MNSSGFDAVAGPDAQVLILGTLPGQASLSAGQYYAQPRNAFWKVMDAVAEAGPSLTYQERLRRLVRQRIALWDVCASASRSGSLDSRIRIASVELNDFDSFLRAHPSIRQICFNGTKASALFKPVATRLSDRLTGIQLITLPSTSPAHAAMSLERKVEVWRAALTLALSA